MCALQFLQSVLQARLIGCPITRHEDEAIEHHGRTDDGDVLERLFEDDVDAAVLLARVRKPPQVQPLGVYLMVGNHNQAFWEVRHEPAIFGLGELACDGAVAGDADQCWSEPLRDRC